MRISIYIATIGLIFSSCGNIATKKPIEVNIIKTKEEIRLDSIKKQEELIVFGSIRFGMNKEEFEKSKDKFIVKCKVYYGKDKKDYQCKIGDYWFSDIIGEFYNEKLHSVSIKGEPLYYGDRHEEYFDNNIRFTCNALIEVLKKKYGNPNRETGFYSLSINELQSIYSGHPYKLENWKIGDKIIQMSIVKAHDEKFFALNLEVYQQSIVQPVEEENERKEKILKEENERKEQNIINKGVEVL